MMPRHRKGEKAPPKKRAKKEVPELEPVADPEGVAEPVAKPVAEPADEETKETPEEAAQAPPAGAKKTTPKPAAKPAAASDQPDGACVEVRTLGIPTYQALLVKRTIKKEPGAGAPAAGEDSDEEVLSGAEDSEHEAPAKKKPSVGKGTKAKGKKGKGKSKGTLTQRNKYPLEPEQEEALLEWMAEHDETWRRGHKKYKMRKAVWAAKGEEIGVSGEYLEKWWKSVKDWYVRSARS